VTEVRARLRQCRAAIGEFLEKRSEADMVQFALRLAQFELEERHFVHCRLALECAEQLSEGDPFLLDAVDCLRKKLARSSGLPVGSFGSEKRVARSEAMDVLDGIQREDLGSVWRRSWWPYVISVGVVVGVTAVVFGIRSLPDKK
jgi:hypothetical protein